MAEACVPCAATGNGWKPGGGASSVNEHKLQDLAHRTLTFARGRVHIACVIQSTARGDTVPANTRRGRRTRTVDVCRPWPPPAFRQRPRPPRTRWPSPLACSGLMYVGVPARPPPLPKSSSFRASPKSATQGLPEPSSEGMRSANSAGSLTIMPPDDRLGGWTGGRRTRCRG
jgi:hypothetical protein